MSHLATFDPAWFRLEAPALISFGGGRTSALMLRLCLDAHGGRLPDGAQAVFANTGKEREETLVFVDEVARRWNVPIVWLERSEEGFAVVDFESAHRLGEPYEALIQRRKFLPNPVARYCTTELKIRPMKKFMLAAGHEHWTNVVGIRADEPRRVARIRERSQEDHWDVAVPLFDAGVTEADVLAFWKAQPFDLQLRRWEGNCDLCFLKGGGETRADHA